AMIDYLDGRVARLDAVLGPLAREDERARLVTTIAGVGRLLALTIASAVADIARFAVPVGGTTGRLLRPRSARPPVRRVVPEGPAREGRIAAVALGGGRGSRARLEAREPVAATLRRRRPPRRTRQRCRDRGRRQDRDRRLARARSQRTLRARCPCGGSDRPGRLEPAPGRLTADLRS